MLFHDFEISMLEQTGTLYFSIKVINTPLTVKLRSTKYIMLQDSTVVYQFKNTQLQGATLGTQFKT